MKKAWLLSGVAVALVAGGWTLSASGGKVADKPETPVLAFTAAEAKAAAMVAMPDVIEISGPLVAPRTAQVKAKASGTLLSLSVAEGAQVRAGQRIGELDLSEHTSRLQERGALVEAARTSAEQAERQHQANQRLAEQGFISSTALISSKASLDNAKAQLKAAQAGAVSAQVGLRDATLVAPIDGWVAKRHVLAGEKLSMEQGVITIVDLRVLELQGSVGSHEVSRLKVGQAVNVWVDGEQQAREARIDRISPAADPGTRSIGVIVSLQNSQETLRAGQFATARLEVGDAAARKVVPVTALSSASGQEYVWTLERPAAGAAASAASGPAPAGALQLVRRAVTTGKRSTRLGLVEVVGGLPDQAIVLTRKFDNLKEGQWGRVAASPASAPKS